MSVQHVPGHGFIQNDEWQIKCVSEPLCVLTGESVDLVLCCPAGDYREQTMQIMASYITSSCPHRAGVPWVTLGHHQVWE